MSPTLWRTSLQRRRTNLTPFATELAGTSKQNPRELRIFIETKQSNIVSDIQNKAIL